MPLYLPAGIRHIHVDPKHPHFHELANTGELVVMLNGEPFDKPIIAADEVNGFIRVLKTNAIGEALVRVQGKLVRPQTYTVKGHVELFLRKEEM